MLDYLPFAVIALLLIAAHLRDQRHADALSTLIGAHEEDRYNWTRERQELLTRVQAPHLIPRPMPIEPTPEASDEVDEGDEFDRLGEIEMAA